MQIKHLLNYLLVLLLILGTGADLAAQDGDINLDEGKELFRANCASCHNKNMKDDLTGPALANTEEDWADYPREDLYNWIRRSQAMIQQGHPKAVELWSAWKPTVMTNFTGLSDAQIENILAYIDGVATGAIGGAPAGQVAATDGAAQEGNNYLLYATLAIMLGLLGLILARIASVLNSLAEARETGVKKSSRTFRDLLLDKTVIFFVIFGLVLFGGYFTVNNAIDLGRQEGYQPEQPVKFSHVTHADVNQIDCQFCHDGARRSKHSVIPSGSTCMKCHKAIKVGATYGTAELTKIYTSLGYNPMTDKYLDDYDNMSQDSIAAIYKEWIGSQYMKKNSEEELSPAGEREVNKQWDHIVESLTNEQKTKVQGPIEWVRVHNLPDHVYFNHSQHVAVGKVECEQCHGEVKEMEVVEQHTPLSMGWCVNCHRESKVAGITSGNEYYQKTYEDYIRALDNGEREQVTVEDIGGIECQKCHY